MGKAASDKLEAELATYFERKMAIDRLRDKHRLNAVNLVNDPAAEIRERVIGYQRDLGPLIEQWSAQDAAETPSKQKV